MKHRKPRDRQLTPAELEDWRRVVLETHPEPPTPDVKRRLAVVQEEWQD